MWNLFMPWSALLLQSHDLKNYLSTFINVVLPSVNAKNDPRQGRNAPGSFIKLVDLISPSLLSIDYPIGCVGSCLTGYNWTKCWSIWYSYNCGVRKRLGCTLDIKAPLLARPHLGLPLNDCPLPLPQMEPLAKPLEDAPTLSCLLQ
jgi:hypothetical protein